jgi:hypothetical protein
MSNFRLGTGDYIQLTDNSIWILRGMISNKLLLRHCYDSKDNSLVHRETIHDKSFPSKKINIFSDFPDDLQVICPRNFVQKSWSSWKLGYPDSFSKELLKVLQIEQLAGVRILGSSLFGKTKDSDIDIALYENICPITEVQKKLNNAISQRNIRRLEIWEDKKFITRYPNANENQLISIRKNQWTLKYLWKDVLFNFMVINPFPPPIMQLNFLENSIEATFNILEVHYMNGFYSELICDTNNLGIKKIISFFYAHFGAFSSNQTICAKGKLATMNNQIVLIPNNRNDYILPQCK